MKKYQDYVIKDGIFIGEFEKMYQEFDDPWHQTTSAISNYQCSAVITSLRNFGAKSVLEVGCGLGYMAAQIKNSLPQIKVTGIDISKTAIEKAQNKFPEIFFQVDTIYNISKRKDLLDEYDVIFFAEIMWYILDDLKEIIQNLQLNYRGGIVIVNQTFYKNGQKYGCEYFTSNEEMNKYLGWETLVQESVCEKDKSSIGTHTVYRI